MHIFGRNDGIITIHNVKLPFVVILQVTIVNVRLKFSIDK